MKLNQKAVGFTLLLIITFLSMNIRSTELNDRAIVQALGVDYSNTDYIVTAQVYNPENADTSKSQTKILVGQGNNIAEAIDDINRKNSKTLYLSHNSFVAVGLECASSQIDEVLNFFEKEPQTRPDVAVIITDKAENLINFTSDENTTPAQSVVEILKDAAANGTLSDTRLYEILRLRETPTSDYMIPVISVGDTYLSPTGTLVFKDGSPTALLDKDKTRGYNFIKGNIKDAFMSVNNFGVDIKSVTSKTTVKLLNDTAEFYVYIDIHATAKEGDKTEISQEMKEEIQLKAENAIQESLLENGCDIFEFGAILRKTYPNLIKKQKNWSNDQKISVFVSAECHIE